VYAYGKSSLGQLRDVLAQQLDPYYLAPLGAEAISLAALQARALLHNRDYVLPEDVSALSPHVFGHRLECAPGVIDKAELIRTATAPVMEQLSKLSLSR